MRFLDLIRDTVANLVCQTSKSRAVVITVEDWRTNLKGRTIYCEDAQDGADKVAKYLWKDAKVRDWAYSLVNTIEVCQWWYGPFLIGYRVNGSKGMEDPDADEVNSFKFRLRVALSSTVFFQR